MPIETSIQLCEHSSHWILSQAEVQLLLHPHLIHPLQLPHILTIPQIFAQLGIELLLQVSQRCALQVEINVVVVAELSGWRAIS